MDGTSKLAMNIRQQLFKKNLTQKELRYRTGLGEMTISGLTRGKGNPTISTISAVAKALDVPLVKLLDGV